MAFLLLLKIHKLEARQFVELSRNLYSLVMDETSNPIAKKFVSSFIQQL